MLMYYFILMLCIFSGKTTFYMTLLQELKPQCGTLFVGMHDNDSSSNNNNDNNTLNNKLCIAYASQQPWVLSETVRDNISFEQPYEPE
jgi:ABC-type transport system involved in cytochrome bd biosynthesis fused ATPase/permease subunit